MRCDGCGAEIEKGGFRVMGLPAVRLVCRPSCLAQWWWRRRFSRRRAA